MKLGSKIKVTRVLPEVGELRAVFFCQRCTNKTEQHG